MALVVLSHACGIGGTGGTGSMDDFKTVERALFVPPSIGAPFAITATPPPNILNPPVTAQAVGSVTGSGRVTRSGTYSYSIPIKVPAGRAGLTPDLSLIYDSAGTDGLMGIGWSLSAGQSIISRCNMHYASGFRRRTTDARLRRTEGVQFKTTDQLCLDGEKLEVVSGTSGLAGSEYRTEIANDAKIVASGSSEPDTFKVHHKSGLIGTYTKHGGTNASGTAAVGLFRAGNIGAHTLLWTQTKLEDRSGNAIEYVWTKENATALGQEQSLPRLTTINYTTCSTANGNTCPYGTAGARQIVFEYEIRPDARVSYLNGARLDAKYRVQRVKVYGAVGVLATQYTLSYRQSAFTNRSLLETITQCGGANATDCLPKTTFTWQDRGKNDWDIKMPASFNLVAPGQPDIAGTEPNASEVSYVLFDANGDGNQDIVVKDWPSSAINPSTGQLLRTSDTMGLGPVDYLILGDGEGSFDMSNPAIIDLEGDGTPFASVRCASSPPASAFQGEIADLSATTVIDLDMDGREELLAPMNIGCPFRWVTTTRFGVSTGVRQTPGMRLTPRTTADVNSGFQRVYQVLNLDRATGRMTKRAAPVPFFNTGFWDTWKYSFADLTGDGLPEVLYGNSGNDDAVIVGRASPNGTGAVEGGNPEIQYMPLGPSGGGYDTRLRFSWQPVGPSVRTPNVLRVLDENGDGRSEIMQLSYDGGQRGFSLNSERTQAIRTYSKGLELWTQAQNLDGTGGTPAHEWPPYPTPETFISQVMSWRYIDINGDGLKDALYAKKNNSTNKYEWFYRINTGQQTFYLTEQPVGRVDDLDKYGRAQQIQVTGGVVKVPQDTGMRIADMNGDGRDDLVLLDSTLGSIMYSNGAGFDAPVSLPPRGSGTVQRLSHPGNSVAWPFTQLADLDGDGLVELVEFIRHPTKPNQRTLVTLRHRLLSGYDVITKVTDGLSTAAAETVTYGKLSGAAWPNQDHPLHKTDAIPRFDGTTRTSPVCRYPARCVSTGMAVASFESLRGTQITSSSFQYAGARVDVTGRGSLGFRTIETTDRITGTKTIQTFDQSGIFTTMPDLDLQQLHLYPYLAAPKTVVTESGFSGSHFNLAQLPNGAKHVLTTTTWTPTFASLTNASPSLRITRSVTDTVIADAGFDGSREDRIRETNDASYDDNGNVTSSTRTTRDLGTLDTESALAGVTTVRTTTATYVPPNLATWMIGLPERITVTSTTNDANCAGMTECASVVQTTAYEYETAARRLLNRIIREPDGDATVRQTTAYERDGAGLVRRTRVSDSAGHERVSETDFESNGFYPQAMRNPMGHVTWTYHDVNNDVLDQTFDANGVWLHHTHDTLGRLRGTHRSDGSNVLVSFSRPTEGTDITNAVTIVDSAGANSKTFFDAQGRATLVLLPGFDPLSSGSPNTTTTLATVYDALGNPIKKSFNKLSQSYVAATGATPASLRTAHESGAEVLMAAQFDVMGRPATATTGDPNKTGSTEGAGERTAYAYARLGDTVVVDPLGHERRVVTDARGNTRRAIQGKAGGVSTSRIPTDYGYSALGKLAYVKTLNAPAEKSVYDRLGRQTQWLMAGSPQSRTWSYTAFDQVERANEASLMSVKFGYDALGRTLSRVEDANPNTSERTITFEWDTSVPQGGGAGVVTLGALAKATVQDGHETSYTYDSQGRPYTITEQFFNGPRLLLGYRYDGTGRLSRIIYPNMTQAGVPILGLDIVYNFASNGMLRAVTNVQTGPNLVLWTVNSRHPLGMLAQATNGDGLVTNWQYYPNTLRDKQQNITFNADTAVETQAFTYHANGLLKSRVFTAGQWASESYDYTQTGHRLTDYTRTGPSFVPSKIDADYAYANGGDITTVTTAISNGAPDWPSAGIVTHAYGAGDALGGGQGAGYNDLLTTIDPNTVGPSGTVSYGYDAAGRQTFRFVGGIKKRSIASYNTFNLPTSIKIQNGENVDSTTLFEYSATGERVSKKRATGSSAEESVLYISKLFEAQSFRDNSDVRRSLFRVYAEGRPIAEIAHAWDGGVKTTQYLYVDHQGSVTYRTEGMATRAADGSSASAGGWRAYLPFGKRWSLFSEPPMFSSIGYTGHIHDDDLGLINMIGRVYDTEQQRFISRDPMMVPYALGGTNAYAYVLGNPMNLTDPSGFCPVGYDELNGGCTPTPVTIGGGGGGDTNGDTEYVFTGRRRKGGSGSCNSACVIQRQLDEVNRQYNRRCINDASQCMPGDLRHQNHQWQVQHGPPNGLIKDANGVYHHTYPDGATLPVGWTGDPFAAPAPAQAAPPAPPPSPEAATPPPSDPPANTTPPGPPVSAPPPAPPPVVAPPPALFPQVQWAVGASLDYTAHAWWGGSVGLNLQYTSDGGLGVYFYRPLPLPGTMEGFGTGGSFTLNYATGPGGPWTGMFSNIGGTAFGGAAGMFSSDPTTMSPRGTSGWSGYSAGIGAGIGAFSNQTYYHGFSYSDVRASFNRAIKVMSGLPPLRRFGP